MAFTFLNMAGMFVLLGAETIAAFQVLIYVGAITVLILFGVMFTPQSPRPYGLFFQKQTPAGALIAAGRIELIGSGYAQVIGPLVPAEVNAANLRIGNAVYESLLGVRPSLALVNEQAYSAGLVGLYLDAGYRAILMDWDNPGAHHPEWHPETRHLPQRALGTDGRSIALLWTNTVAFQKLQRFAHGDIALADYLGWLRGRHGESDRALCLYASDAEIFDFRPGRYKTEETCSGREWDVLAMAFAALGGEERMHCIAPSEALRLLGEDAAGQTLRLETPSCPVPVTKPRNYKLAGRAAVEPWAGKRRAREQPARQQGSRGQDAQDFAQKAVRENRQVRPRIARS